MSAMKWLKIGGIALAVPVAALVGLGIALHRARPTGTPSAEADAVARQVAARVDAEAWARTGAVRWEMQGRRRHLWDRERGFARVGWGDDSEVLLRIGDQSGLAFEGGAPVEGDTAKDMLDRAYSMWCNDSFWLNPLVKLFDDGVERALVDADGAPGLLVSYGDGGVTPGDSYLWTLDADGMPASWRMWVSIIPVGGLEVTWGGWKKLDTGALVSTQHEAGPITLEMVDVAGAETLAALTGGDDPFAPLLERPASRPATSTTAAALD